MSHSFYQFPHKSSSHKTVYLIPILKDNYVFVLVNDKNQGLIIDPGSSQEIIEFLENKKIVPIGFLITHSHPDHIDGLANLTSKYPKAKLINHRHHDEINEFQSNDFNLEIISSPGHLKDHIMFYETEEKWLFCGDVLFRYGCGRIFDGTYEEMFTSLCKIKNLPHETYIFCTHEYTKMNLEFCIAKGYIDQGLIPQLLKEAGTIPTVPFSLEKEIKLNPFLSAATLEKFKELRLLRNIF